MDPCFIPSYIAEENPVITLKLVRTRFNVWFRSKVRIPCFISTQMVIVFIPQWNDECMFHILSHIHLQTWLIGCIHSNANSFFPEWSEVTMCHPLSGIDTILAMLPVSLSGVHRLTSIQWQKIRVRIEVMDPHRHNFFCVMWIHHFEVMD